VYVHEDFDSLLQHSLGSCCAWFWNFLGDFMWFRLWL